MQKNFAKFGYFWKSVWTIAESPHFDKEYAKLLKFFSRSDFDKGALKLLLEVCNLQLSAMEDNNLKYGYRQLFYVVCYLMFR